MNGHHFLAFLGRDPPRDWSHAAIALYKYKAQAGSQVAYLEQRRRESSCRQGKHYQFVLSGKAALNKRREEGGRRGRERKSGGEILVILFLCTKKKTIAELANP